MKNNNLYNLITEEHPNTLYGTVQHFEPHNDEAINDDWAIPSLVASGIGVFSKSLAPLFKLNSAKQYMDFTKYTPEEITKQFFNINSSHIKPLPPNYEGNRDIVETLRYLGSKNDINATIRTPKEDIIFNQSNIIHPLFDNEPNRLGFLNRTIETFKDPNLILRENKGKNSYNLYFKAFKDNDNTIGHYGVVKNTNNRTFFNTAYPLKGKKLKNKLTNRQVIYNNLPDPTVTTSNDASADNIINNFTHNFKPKLFEYLKGLFCQDK